MADFLARLSSHFGVRFLIQIATAYGIGQGIIESVTGFASAYVYTDPLPSGFDLAATRIAALSGISGLPWIAKPLFGFLSDCVPIFGLRRTPYIIIASLLGTLGFGLLALLRPGTSLSPLGAAFLLGLGSLSIACPDVMIDATVAEASQRTPALATDLQSFLWAAYGSCEIMASLIKGPLLVRLGARPLLGLLGVASIATAVPASLGWLGERPLPTVLRGHQKRASQRHYLLGLVVVAGAVAQVAVGVLLPSLATLGATAVVGFVCVAVWRVEHAKAPRFARAAIFLFLDGALSPSTGTVLFKWYKATPDNCARGRPCFEPPLIGWLDLATQISYLVGVVAYNRWLSHLSYRAIFVGAHLLLCASAFVTLIWVGRWNLRVGVPDPAFALADNLLLPLIGRFLKIPKFVLAARACPPEAAATTFAILMMLYNFGGQVSGYAGIGLLQLLGGVEPPEFRHLERMVVSQALLKLLPIAAVWLLVPPGEGPRTPDPVLVVDADQDADAEGPPSVPTEVGEGSAAGADADGRREKSNDQRPEVTLL